MKTYILLAASLFLTTFLAYGEDLKNAVPDAGSAGSAGSAGGQVVAGRPTGSGGEWTPDYNFTGARCSFRPSLSPEDSAVLANAMTTIQSLRDNEACQVMAPQFDAFQRAMESYNAYNGTDRSAGYDGRVNVNCSNYEQIYDVSFDFFVSNHSSRNNNLPPEYQSCINTDRAAAINCAAQVTGQLKANKRHSCEEAGVAINQAERARLVGATYEAGLSAVNAILENQSCVDATGSQRLSFIQSAVGLAGRAATIGAGPVAGTLIGAATNVVTSLVNNLFRNGNRDTFTQLENRANMAEIACLYEELEDKANRCDRLLAGIANENSLPAVQAAQACIAGSHSAVSEVDRLLNQASNIVSNLNAPPQDGETAEEFSEQMFNNLAESLEATFPGTNQTVMDVGEQAADNIINALQGALASDESLRSYLIAQNGGQNLAMSEMRTRGHALRERLERAQRVKATLQAIRETNSSLSISSEQLQNVRNNLSGSVNFMGDFNLVLQEQISEENDLSENIVNYNSMLSEARQYRSVIELYNNKERIRNSSFDDDGMFDMARNSVRPYLADMLRTDLDDLRRRAVAELSVMPTGAPQNRAIEDERRNKGESIIYPILRACSQLQSVMNEGDRPGFQSARIDDQHEVCRAVTCEQGVQSFSAYLAANNRTVPDEEVCVSEPCTAQYSRYICEQKGRLPTIHQNMRDEFVNQGTLCGRPLREAFTAPRRGLFR